MTETLQKIHDLVKETYGEYTRVDIEVTSTGIHIKATGSANTLYAMKTINGNWIKDWRDEE